MINEWIEIIDILSKHFTFEMDAKKRKNNPYRDLF